MKSSRAGSGCQFLSNLFADSKRLVVSVAESHGETDFKKLRLVKTL
jgi:hypothetical protein